MSPQTKLYVFDKDDTITPPSQKIDTKHTSILCDFVMKQRIVFLTARNIECCQEHILDPLLAKNPNIPIENIYFACSNGAEIYKFQNKKSLKISTDTHASELQKGTQYHLEDLCKQTIQVVQEIFPQASIEIRGDFFVAIPCIPRTASIQERESCDPDSSKRKAVIKQLHQIFPDFFEILPGGKTSIDIAVINKEYGMRHIMKYFKIENPENIHYFGDAFDGGNDEPVKNIKGICIHEVSNPNETFEYLQKV